MDTSRVQSLVDHLEDHIDDLEGHLQPIISQALGESTRKLPLLDKAKLHIVMVYAIESLLFSYLKLHNVDAKEHPVFRELIRVKQYFEKIKSAEEGPVQPRESLSLNKQAAARIIKHSLAGNDKSDLARLEQEARAALLAKRRLRQLEADMKAKENANAQSQTHPQDEVTPGSEEPLGHEIAAEIERERIDDVEDAEPSVVAAQTSSEAHPKKYKEKKRKRREDEKAGNSPAKPGVENAKAGKKARKKNKKDAKANG